MLSKFLLANIRRFATDHTQHMLSETALRYFIYLLNAQQIESITRSQQVPKQYDFIRLENIAEYVANIPKTEAIDSPRYYGILLEMQKRSSHNIHYAALDIIVRPNQEMLAVLADHYRDEPSYPELEHIDWQLIKIGQKGEKQQHDSYSCYLFALAHLISTAEHPEIFEQLETQSHAACNIVSWLTFPPQFVWHAQSMSFLWRYIEYLHDTMLQLPHDQPAFELSKSITSFEGVFSFESFISEHISTAPCKTGGLQVRNSTIQHLVQLFADYLLQDIEKTDTHRTSQEWSTLLAIEEQYPHVHQLLCFIFENYQEKELEQEKLSGICGFIESLLHDPSSIEHLIAQKALTRRKDRTQYSQKIGAIFLSFFSNQIVGDKTFWEDLPAMLTNKHNIQQLFQNRHYFRIAETAFSQQAPIGISLLETLLSSNLKWLELPIIQLWLEQREITLENILQTPFCPAVNSGLITCDDSKENDIQKEACLKRFRQPSTVLCPIEISEEQALQAEEESFCVDLLLGEEDTEEDTLKKPRERDRTLTESLPVLSLWNTNILASPASSQRTAADEPSRTFKKIAGHRKILC